MDTIFSVVSILFYRRWFMEFDILKTAAEAYKKLMNIEYRIVLGRKGKEEQLNIIFTPENFYHLAGFHKLRQRYSFQKKTSAWILEHILEENISIRSIEQDQNWLKVVGRLRALCMLEKLMDAQDTKFYSYDMRKVTFATKIDADYLAQGRIENAPIVFSFFIKADSNYCMKSIFFKEAYDYSFRQTQYTVLLKEKITRNEKNIISRELYRHNKYHIK